MTWIGLRMTSGSSRASCSTTPASWIASTNGRLLPSPPGTSPTVPPDTSTTALSIPMPASAAMQCSTVSTKACRSAGRSAAGGSRTFSTQRRDRRDLPVLLADEGDAGIRPGGRERERRRLAGEQAGPGERRFTRHRLLAFCYRQFSHRSHKSSQPLSIAAPRRASMTAGADNRQ